ncbi:hypothetical protein MAR_035398, partial [Mya arenaria]
MLVNILVKLNIPSTPKSHSRCFICKRPRPKLIVVPSEARFAAFVQRNGIIKSGTRCCPVHMNDSLIKDKALKSFKATESAYVNLATDIKSFIRPGHIFVVDRGFRDSLHLLEIFHDVYQDAFISTKRCETIRLVVESANARLKRWKYLDRVLPNSQVPFIGDYVKIICAVCNKYLPPLSPSTADDERQAQQMLQLGTLFKQKLRRETLRNVEPCGYRLTTP